jgi:DNA-binding response OmpR family regulator
VIEAHISNLRRKLDAGVGVASIETLRGRGYRLMPHDHEGIRSDL